MEQLLFASTCMTAKRRYTVQRPVQQRGPWVVYTGDHRCVRPRGRRAPLSVPGAERVHILLRWTKYVQHRPRLRWLETIPVPLAASSLAVSFHRFPADTLVSAALRSIYIPFPFPFPAPHTRIGPRHTQESYENEMSLFEGRVARSALYGTSTRGALR